MPINELREAGLLTGTERHLLTEKGRDWLKLLEDAANGEDAEERTAELILSINAISR